MVNETCPPAPGSAAHRRLLEAAPRALERLRELANSDDPAIALEAAAALLDRAGYGPTSTQVQVDSEEQ